MLHFPLFIMKKLNQIKPVSFNIYVTRHANRDLLGSYVITSELTF